MKVNLEKLIEVLNGLDIMLDVVLELSKNVELSEVLEEIKYKVNTIILSIQYCIDS
jgi:hypothetical protein